MNDTDEREALLALPSDYSPIYSDLLEAVKAHMAWCMAENRNLGSFHDKMDLCKYAEWSAAKALGLPHEPEWKGVPRIVIRLKKQPA